MEEESKDDTSRIIDDDTLQDAADKLARQAKTGSLSNEDIRKFNNILLKEVRSGKPNIEAAQQLSRTFWKIYVGRFLSAAEDGTNTWYETFLEKANASNGGSGDPLFFLHPCDKDIFVAAAGDKERNDKNSGSQRKRFAKTIAYSNSLINCRGKKKNGNKKPHDLLDDDQIDYDYAENGIIVKCNKKDLCDWNLSEREDMPPGEYKLEPGVPHPVQGCFYDESDKTKPLIVALGKNPACAARIWREQQVNCGEYWLAERNLLGLHLCGEECKETFYQFRKIDWFEDNARNLIEAAEREQASNWYRSNYMGSNSLFSENANIETSEELEKLLSKSFTQMEFFPYQSADKGSIPSVFVDTENWGNDDGKKYLPLPSQFVTLYLLKALVLELMGDDEESGIENRKIAFIVRDKKTWLDAIEWMFPNEDDREKAVFAFKENGFELIGSQKFTINYNALIPIALREAIQGKGSCLYNFAHKAWEDQNPFKESPENPFEDKESSAITAWK